MAYFVFDSYTQEELDRQYDQSAWSKLPPSEYERMYRQLSDQSVRAIGPPLEHQYGPAPEQKLDIYRAEMANAPVVVFVHGGAWRTLSKAHSGFAAELFCTNDVNFVALDFGLTPKFDMWAIVSHVRNSLAWLYQNASNLGVDRERIYICGHSSGAHLAACVATTDWQNFGLPDDIIKGCVSCSGGYDLEPVYLSARNKYMHLTPDLIALCSPNRHVTKLKCPITLAAAEHESEEFMRQSREFAKAANVALHVSPGMDHFEVSFTLGLENGLLANLVLDQIHENSAAA